jgi:hypothetical protein
VASGLPWLSSLQPLSSSLSAVWKQQWLSIDQRHVKVVISTRRTRRVRVKLAFFTGAS